MHGNSGRIRKIAAWEKRRNSIAVDFRNIVIGSEGRPQESVRV
jgi:hypothetical protein